MSDERKLRRRKVQEHLEEDEEVKKEKFSGGAKRKFLRKGQEDEDDEDEDEDEEGEASLLDALPPSIRPSTPLFVSIAVYVVLWVCILLWEKRLAVCFLVLHVPVWILLFVWFRHRHTVALDDMLIHYAAGMLPAVIIVYFFQYLGSLLLFAMHKGLSWADMIKREGGGWHVADYAVIIAFSFIAFTLPEELFKYAMARRTVAERGPSRAQVLCCTSAAVGFSTGQAFVVMFIARVASNLFPWGVELTTVMWILFGTPLHVLTAYCMTLQLVLNLKYDKPISRCRSVGVGVIFRGTAICATLLGVLTTDSPWLGTVPAALAAFFLLAYARLLERGMPQEYMEQVQYMGVAAHESIIGSSRAPTRSEASRGAR